MLFWLQYGFILQHDSVAVLHPLKIYTNNCTEACPGFFLSQIKINKTHKRGGGKLVSSGVEIVRILCILIISKTTLYYLYILTLFFDINNFVNSVDIIIIIKYILYRISLDNQTKQAIKPIVWL